MKLQDLFEDLTVPQLQQSIQQGFPGTRKRQNATHEVRVDKTVFIPMEANNILQVKAETSSNNGNRHQQNIHFKQVRFDAGNAKFVGNDGQEHSIQPLLLNTTTVGVNCNCEDYIWRFATFNLNNKCHIGPIPPKYVRKTTNRPPSNPNNVPGMCKHLLKVVEDLRQKGLVR